jgi:hypothetical protein
MAIIDKRLELADGAACTGASGATVVVGDVIDLERDALDIGTGEPVNILARILAGLVAAGAGTATFNLVTADNAALTTNPVILATTGALVTQASTPAAGVAAGVTLFDQTIPRRAIKRYLGITIVIATNNVSAGTIDAFIGSLTTNQKAYPNAI